MENQEGFERLVPYRTEKELKEATKWYNTVDCKKIIDRETIEMILYNALNKYAPWEDFCMDKRDVKGFFYINALAYALLTFKYLSSPYMTLENIMCDSKQGEAVEGNIGLKSKIKEFQEKCRGICNNNERWKERIREKVGAENRSEDQKIKIEHYVNLIKLTSVYKGYKQDKIEMRGDRAEMSDFPLYLNTVAGGLDRRDQTIGGFSFVVKIYAVPVVEIIG